MIVPVYVIIVSFSPADVILWNSEAIKVLKHCDHWTDAIVDGVQRVAPPVQKGTVEETADSFLDKTQRVVLLVVEVATDLR